MTGNGIRKETERGQTETRKSLEKEGQKTARRGLSGIPSITGHRNASLTQTPGPIRKCQRKKVEEVSVAPQSLLVL